MRIRIKHIVIISSIVLASLTKVYSQNSTEYIPTTKMSPNDSIMYSLLKESIYIKIKDSLSLHFFPLYKTVEEDSSISINTIVYTKHNKNSIYPISYPNKDGVKSFTLLFKKRKKKSIVSKNFEDNSNILTVTDEKEIEKPIKNVISVYETDAKAITGKGLKPALLFRTQKKPLFENQLYDSKIIFKYEKPNIIVDTSLYKGLKYDFIKYIDKDYVVLKHNNKFGIITSKNDTLVPFEFKNIDHYRYGFLLNKKSHHYSLISSDAKIRSKSYETIRFNDSKNKFFIAKRSGVFTFLDINSFKEVLPREYRSLEKIYRDFIITTKKSGYYIIKINEWNETRYDSLHISDKQDFGSGKELLIQVKRDNYWGLISLYNEKHQILDFKYKSIKQYKINSFNNNIQKLHTQQLTYIVEKNDKYALFNSENNGNWLTSFEYDELFPLNNKFVGRKNKDYYLLKLNGMIVSDKYDKILLDIVDNKLEYIGIKNNTRKIINID